MLFSRRIVYILRQGPSLALGSLFRPDWLVSKAQGSTSASQGLGLPVHAVSPSTFHVGSGVLVLVLTLARQALTEFSYIFTPVAS